MDRIVLALRTFFSVALPYFRSEDRWPAALLLPGWSPASWRSSISRSLITNWNASFFNALEARNWNAFSRELDRVLLDRRRRHRVTASAIISAARRCRSAGGAG